jgi:uncharacterized protein YbjT (DUF2867 family)
MAKNIIIAGATGMVGNHVLQYCLKSEEVAKVTSLVRKPSNHPHPKLNEIIVKDFTQLIHLEDVFKDQDVAYFCIGVYTGSVSREVFRAITVDMPVAFGQMLKAHSPAVRYVLLSGAGADRTEKSNMMFAKDKGTAENKLSAMGLGAFHTFRPGYIYPVEKRKEPNLSYAIMRNMYPLLRMLGKKYSIKSTELAMAMFKVGLHGAEHEVLENDAILEHSLL